MNPNALTPALTFAVLIFATVAIYRHQTRFANSRLIRAAERRRKQREQIDTHLHKAKLNRLIFQRLASGHGFSFYKNTIDGLTNSITEAEAAYACGDYNLALKRSAAVRRVSDQYLSDLNVFSTARY
jgi:hypothetical protein